MMKMLMKSSSILKKITMTIKDLENIIISKQNVLIINQDESIDYEGTAYYLNQLHYTIRNKQIESIQAVLLNHLPTIIIKIK